MQSDTVKLLSSHIVAVLGCIAGPVLLVYIFQNLNTIQGSEGFIALIAGWIGASFQFLYGSEIRTASARQTEKAVQMNTPNGTGSVGLVAPHAYEDEFTGDPEDGDLAPTETTTTIPPTQ